MRSSIQKLDEMLLKDQVDGPASYESDAAVIEVSLFDRLTKAGVLKDST